MEIQVTHPYEHHWYLTVNGVHVGTEFSGGTKHLSPEKWAKSQLKKRLAVIQRNVERLKDELDVWNREREQLLHDSN